MVLSTTIAETSLTIEGIRVVVDSGLRRYAEFDPVTGMSHLVTAKVSQAAADQRRGRAGRLSAGHCYRLWSEGTQASLAPQTAPEILHLSLIHIFAEAPCCTSGGGILPLADFVRANYGEDNNSDPGTNYATDSAVKDGPISAFGSNVEEITMESGSLKEAAPTALSSDGTSFSVYWDAE